MEAVIDQPSAVQPLDESFTMPGSGCCEWIRDWGGDFYKETNIYNGWKNRDSVEGNLCQLGFQVGIRTSLRERHFEYARLKAADPNVYAERIYEVRGNVSRWGILEGCFESIFCLPFQVFRRVLDSAAHHAVCVNHCFSFETKIDQKDLCQYHTGVLCGDLLAMPLECCYTAEKVLCFACTCCYFSSIGYRKPISCCPESFGRVGFFDDVAGKVVNPKEPFTSTAAMVRVIKKQDSFV